jgi:hypothetical protein
MDAFRCLSGGSFGQAHFGGCDLGDLRLTARVVKTADRLLAHPGGTLPEKLNRNADLIGFYRLANNPKVTHAKLIAAHAAHTRELMARCAGVVLVLHDTTELDFSGLDVADLGPIGHGGCRGYLAHNSLAYDFESAEVLGLASQTLHVRRKVPKGESPKAKREHPDRESRLWKKGFAALGPPPKDKLRVNVADRGADLNEFIEAVESSGDHYVIRSKTNRNIEIRDGDGGGGDVRLAKLHEHAATLPVLGTRAVNVEHNNDQAKRTATVQVRCGPVTLRPRHCPRGESSGQSIASFVVHVEELNPPDNVTPLKWILLTNVPAGTFAEANRRIDWYACRPAVEELHKAMKTGCGIEMPQFTTGQALRVSIAMQSVVATQLLRLRDLSRAPDAGTRPASDLIESDYVEAAGQWRVADVRSMSVLTFFMIVAKMGGHLNRRGDRPPGWLVLWRGWSKLQLLVEGAIGERRRRCV